MQVDHPSMLVELLFEGIGIKNVEYLSKSDPFVKVFLTTEPGGPVHEVGRTETVDNCLDPKWKNSVPVRYFFQMKQQIRFQVRDDDSPTSSKFIGRAVTTLGNIMGKKEQNIRLELKDEKENKAGEIFVRAQKIVEATHHVIMKWKSGKIANVDAGYVSIWGKSDPYLKFLKVRNDNTTVLVGRTQHIENELQPSWKQLVLPLNRLVAKNQPESIFKIECWDWDKNEVNHSLIGEVFIKIGDLYAFAPQFSLVDPTKKIENPGVLVLQKLEMIKVPNWVDCIKTGLQLNLSVAIDLSLSNKPYHDPTSLHFISQHPNQYQQVLTSIWDIIKHYDEDDKIYAYGFGGRPHFPNLNQNTVSNCFSLSGKDAGVSLKGLNDFMDTYVNALKCVEPDEPTQLGGIFETSFVLAKQQQAANVYQLLLVLTDGDVDDVNPTIDLMVKNSRLPISVIIIGLGNGDFSKMKKFDSDHGLVGPQGQPLERDFVQFVPFNRYKGNVNQLTTQILYQIPEQISKYMVLSGKSVIEKIQIKK